MEFARKLSKETRYNRFLGGGVRLTPEMLKNSPASISAATWR